MPILQCASYFSRKPKFDNFSNIQISAHDELKTQFLRASRILNINHSWQLWKFANFGESFICTSANLCRYTALYCYKAVLIFSKPKNPSLNWQRFLYNARYFSISKERLILVQKRRPYSFILEPMQFWLRDVMNMFLSLHFSAGNSENFYR